MLGHSIGKYEIIDIIGRGGMAAVYIGYQKDLDRKVAVKVLAPHPGLDPQFIERFQLEARTIAKLQHPHILPLYDYGVENEVLYLVTPYIDGGSLDKLLVDGRLELPVVERILREVASALDFAHRRGVIHRDIKPANILLDSEGHALLADFGIVKLLDASANLTGTGVVGTPAYMAPEQSRGAGIDSRADLYSLGVVVYEMLTGTQPFDGDTPMQILLKHISQPVPPLKNASPALEAVMQKVMAKDPDERFPTGIAFAEAFSTAVHQGEANFKMPTPAGGETARFATQRFDDNPSATVILPPLSDQKPRSSLPLLAVTVLVLLLVGAAAVFLLSQNQGEDTPPTPTAGAVVDVATPVPSIGQSTFSTISKTGDAVSVRLNNVRPPALGRVYVAWLVDTRDNTTLNIGHIPVDAAGNGAASFQSPDGEMLPARYNALFITEEEVDTASSVTEPAGEVLYESVIPVEITGMLHEVFVSSERGVNGAGLLDSALSEANIAAQHAGLAANSTNIGGLRTHVEHTLNALFGTLDDHDGNGRGSNPGAGIGVYPMLDAMQELVTTATGVDGVSMRAQSEAESISVCLSNVRGWADRVVELERHALTVENLDEIKEEQTESTTLTGQLMTGIDLNGTNSVEPFEGECGLQQIPVNGLLVATMEIVERSK